MEACTSIWTVLFGFSACMGVWQYTCYTCLLAGLQDFECLRPLDDLHHVTSFYTGMSNVPLATVGIGIGDGIEVLLEQKSSQAAVWCVFCVKWIFVKTLQVFPHIIFLWKLFRVTHPLKMVQFSHGSTRFQHHVRVVATQPRLEPLRWTMAFLLLSQGAQMKGKVSFHPSQGFSEDDGWWMMGESLGRLRC